ncbi:MAG: hypothetical protein JWN30_436 [Bacilli bacterium]|nr:hypothetical protein [Bacilli bacterium]
MILKLIGPLLLLSIVTIAEWSEIRTANLTGKTVFFLVLAVSGSIWFYVSTAVHPVRPAVFLEALFKRLDPFT